MTWNSLQQEKKNEKDVLDSVSYTRLGRKDPSANIAKKITWGAVIVPIPDCGVPQVRATSVLFLLVACRLVTGPKEKKKSW